jgi:hypothetical protein
MFTLHAMLQHWWGLLVGVIMASSDLINRHLPEGKKFGSAALGKSGI